MDNASSPLGMATMLAQRQRLEERRAPTSAAFVLPVGGGGPEDDEGEWHGDDAEDALGPPPDCGPVLVRQQATDWTAAREAKAAALAAKVDDGNGHGGGLRAPRLIPGAGGGRRPLGVCL